MSPTTGDDPSSPESSRPSGLANVFRGLTSSRSTRSIPLSTSSSSVALPIADLVHATPAVSRLSPHAMDSFALLKNGTPNERISAANSLKYAISEFPLNPVLDIWYAAKDLIDPARANSIRTAGWELLTECVKHASSTDLERKEFFQTLAAPAHPDDFHLQLAALVDLTHRGRVLDGFDYELLPLLTTWLHECYDAVRNARKFASQAAKSQKSSSSSTKSVVTGEEKNFAQLFAFIVDVVKFSFKSAGDAAVAVLIDKLLDICMNTSVEEDLRSCIAVLDTMVTFGSIPNDRLKGCIQVLSSVYSIVSNLNKDAWRTISNFCRSHNGPATVRILLDILRAPSSDPSRAKDTNRSIKGALSVLQQLIAQGEEKELPSVPYAPLVDGLSSTAKTTTSGRTCAAALEIINALFCDAQGNLNSLILEEDWSDILTVAAEYSNKARTDPQRMRNHQAYAQSLGKEDRPDYMVQRQTLLLIERLEILINQKSGDFIPRQTIVNFFVAVHPLLPDSTSSTVLNYLQEFRCCSPSDSTWEENLALVLDGFFSNRTRSSAVRLQALQIVMDAYEILDLVGDEIDQTSIPNLTKSVLRDIAEETDISVLEAVMSLMVSVATSCEMELFQHIIDALRGIVDTGRLKSPISPGSITLLTQSPSNLVVKGFVKIFVQLMNSHSTKSIALYTVLVQLAKSTHCEVDARLTAMKLLFRLRADWAYRVFVTRDLETTFLATTICRTEESLAKKQAEEAAQTLRYSRSDHSTVSRPNRGISFGAGQAHDRSLPTRSVSSSKAAPIQYSQLWKLPDPAAIPVTIPAFPSPVLVSHDLNFNHTEELADADDTAESEASVLDISAWLDTVLSIIKGADWEVYSFVLVHLPSQLSNHAIFKDALAQIQELRKLVCEQVQRNSFQEPPNASGLRRADVAICLYHSLTMVVSYHDHFQKAEEDEIVKTFVTGIRTWERTAQCCIHALSVCCHELPLSTSKSVGQMLDQMAAIITQPNVAIHILEFLACLSRLREVYVNLREEDYKVIYSICFRYLDYAREKQQMNRGNRSNEPTSATGTTQGAISDLASPSATDDLPQYVYALAYHVIIFWFLALKLPERANYIASISKKLLADVDGSGQIGDEQALTTVDFMQRVTFSDLEESAEDPLFTENRFGEIKERRWIIGNSIITIKQSTNLACSQVVQRRPSYTSVYSIKEFTRAPPLHQVQEQNDQTGDDQHSTNVILPSHLLIQLMAPVPQTSELTRPIPLPEDDAIDRTLRLFDRNPTVDGHKVGVVYIGEGQTEEIDILSNVSGSAEYTEFLNNLGTLTRLKGATFNTQGLDREYDTDGEYTFAWRDRLIEIIFHVTTQMPTNLDRDPQLAMKKRHIGNDFVNIIFNDSGYPFRFDTFPSQFNFVNIVITPASRASFIASREAHLEKGREQSFYRVQVMSKPGFPQISPASESKIVSLKALPEFIRLLALNASVFSLVWQSRIGGEHISSWRSRLREIKRLRDKHGPKSGAQSLTAPSPPPMFPGAGISQQASQQQQQQQAAQDASRPGSSVRESFTSLRRTSVATFFTSSTSEQPSHRSSMFSGSASTNDTEVGGVNVGSDPLVDSVDFSKWA